MNVMAGCRVLVFDSRRFVNDVATPLSVTLRPATVIRRYKRRSFGGRGMDDLVDVRYDGEDRISRGHFVSWLRLL